MHNVSHATHYLQMALLCCHGLKVALEIGDLQPRFGQVRLRCQYGTACVMCEALYLAFERLACKGEVPPPPTTHTHTYLHHEPKNCGWFAASCEQSQLPETPALTLLSSRPLAVARSESVKPRSATHSAWWTPQKAQRCTPAPVPPSSCVVPRVAAVSRLAGRN